MTPVEEKEIIRTLRNLKKDISEIKELVAPISPGKDEIFNFSQTKDFLSFSERKLRRLIAAGTIPYTKKGSRLYFTRNSLIQWLNQ